MARKQIKVSRRMLFTWFMLAGSILLIAPSEWTNNFQFAFLRIFDWPLSIGENISLSVRARRRVHNTDVVSRKQYRELLNYCANVEARLRQQEKEVERLSGLRDKFPLGNAKLVSALVYPASIDRSHGEVIIDKGKDHQLAKGQFVLAENSIIGTVSDVSSGGARIKLFTSPASAIGVEIAGTKGLMHGSGGNLAKIPMIKYKPTFGAEVLAARKGGFLSVPMIVGKVHHCERNRESAVLWDIIVEPVCDIEQLNDVTVIVMNPQD
jgi:cell shape-determining protein MreC